MMGRAVDRSVQRSSRFCHCRRNSRSRRVLRFPVDRARLRCAKAHANDRRQYACRVRPGASRHVGTVLGKVMGMRVIAVDISNDRLKLASEVGADETVDVAKHDAFEGIRKLTGGHGAGHLFAARGRGVRSVSSVKAAP